MIRAIQSIGLVLLAIGSIVGTVVIAATGHAVPDQLWTIDTVLVGAVAGVAVPALSAASVVPAAVATVPPA
jgi:uncharacterized membrane protein